MKSKAIVRGAVSDCWRVSAWLFGAVFCLEMAPFGTALAVSIIRKPLEQSFTTTLSMGSLAAAMILLTLFLFKRSAATGKPGKRKVFEQFRGLSGIIFSFLVLLILISLSWLAMTNLYIVVFANGIGNSGLLIVLYIAFTLIGFALSFIVLASMVTLIVTGLYQKGPLAYLRIYIKALSRLFRRFPATLVMMAALSAGMLLFRLLDNRVVGLLDYVFYDSLASRLVYILLAAALEALVLNFFVLMSERMMAGEVDIGLHDAGQSSPKRWSVRLVEHVVLPIAAAAFLAAQVLILTLGYGTANTVNYDDLVVSHIETGELMLMDSCQLDVSSFNYRRAYSMVLSFQGYIKTILAEKDPAKSGLRFEAIDDFDAAEVYDAANAYYYLFRGYWCESGGYWNDGLRFYRISRNMMPYLADSGFGCSRLEANIGDVNAQKHSIDLIVSQGSYQTLYDQYKSYTPDQLEKLLGDYEKTRVWLLDRLAVSALERYKMNDAKGMYDEISMMVFAEPDNPNLLLLQALAAVAYRPETYNYPTAAAAVDKLSQLVPGNDDIQELYAVIMLTSKDYQKAADLFGALFAKYPENSRLGEQYAYALLAGSRDNEAMEVCEDLLVQYPDNWLCHYIMATARLKLGSFDDSLSSILEFYDDTGLDIYSGPRDMFLNAFCMAYSLQTMRPEAMSALNSLPEGSFLKHYILGVTAWRDRDLTKSLDEISRVIEDEPALGMAWFLKASVLFEQSRQDPSIDMAELESDFTRAAALQPYSIEIWFSLGNFYKAWGGHDAQELRAYRRVIDLEPYSDHTHDYYGVTYHALIEIDRLEATEWSAGEE